MTAQIVDGVVYSPYPDFDVQNHCAPRVIREGLSKFGEKVVAIDNVYQLTGNQLLRRIQRYALGFQRSGLKPGSYVCAHLSNTVDTVAAVLGVVFTGATVVMARPTLVTSDVGYLDDVGRLYIVDRLKQMIKCMDNQLAPAELEEILMSHYAVEEVSVIGLPSAKYGEAPAACVVLRDAYKESHKAIQEQLKQLVAGTVFKNHRN
ncbi:hypothetical protein HPB47_002919 [Ixodes persulcatus]|uniref:Uncharacterized protein n=1 Tax=Ixodes persulcatus TaxID=34615 RepID=A0AC60PLC0_IXOPE|nr:hypothetical protein HPB47_002919 [Ixodes persulcatus]